MKHANTRIAAVSVLLLGAVHAASAGSSQTQPEPRDYVFVFLKTGPTTDLTQEERSEAFAGHFANMERMANDGDLLIAGPLGEPKSDEDHRGIFVLDKPTLEEGMALANTDPTTKLGVFVLEGFVFSTEAPLTDLPRLDNAAEEARLADPDVPDEWVGRMYMLVTSPFSAEAIEAMNTLDGVLIAGKLHGSGPDADSDGEPDDEVLAWLDAETEEEAEAMLGGQPGWTLHGWYGSAEVEKMAE
jgi:uncharacterized protein YciI